jgi:hypothetical protein
MTDARYDLSQAVIRRRSIANPGYRVRIFPNPVVIDRDDRPVADAFVVAIRFPRTRTGTSAGHVPVVKGAGEARILVGDATIRGVPLC